MRTGRFISKNETVFALFLSFGKRESGRFVTENKYWAVINARNPYGTHNLVLVDKETDEAFRHGLGPVLIMLKNWDEKTYRKTVRALYKRGELTEGLTFNYNRGLIH